MSMTGYCTFVSDELKDGDLIYRVLEIHFKNGFIGHIRVSSQQAQRGTYNVWHYEIYNGRITLFGVGSNSVKFLGKDGVEVAHETIANWELR